jgi:Cu/Ag efflux protein CusF
MRTLLFAFAALMLSAAAQSAEAEGQIKAIDRENLTITLQNGKTYKLPGEFDVDSLEEGMDVLLAYDQIGGENLITDMMLFE